MLNVIAVDDEPVALEVIRKFASGVPYIRLNATFTRSSKAIEYLGKESADLLFLDIKMPDVSGIDLLKSLKHPPMVIFTTAYSKHAVESFEWDAIDFLLKPFSEPRFLKACAKALQQSQLRRNFQSAIAGAPGIFVKTGYEQVRVPLEGILYVEGSGNYVQFKLKKDKILSRISLAEAEKMLPASAFLRVHRSFIIALRHISKMERNVVWINDIAIPVSTKLASIIRYAMPPPDSPPPPV
jgi:DNA-binding LytR/AlgR family response regulator